MSIFGWKLYFLIKVSEKRYSNLGVIGMVGCNEMCPENCNSTWVAYVGNMTDDGDITGVTKYDEKIVISCGKITFQNIFTLSI